MKKLFTIILFAFSFLTFTNNDGALDQKFLLSNLNFDNVKVYEKYKEVHARKAVVGEVILTITADGKETQNTAKEGDFVVKNLTGAGEMYILTAKKFNARYELKENIDETWSLYRPLGKVKALQVKLETSSKEIYILAPWGEKMVVKDGDFLVTPLDNSEVYRIAEKEFYETYR